MPNREALRRQGQQLFLVLGFLPHRSRETRHDPATDPGPLMPPSWRQDALFTLPHTLPPGLGPKELACRANPQLKAWAEQVTRQYAAQCGWRPHTTRRVRSHVNTALGLLQTPHTVLTPADVTFLGAAGNQNRAPAHAIAVLTLAGLLEGEHLPAVLAWAGEQISLLPSPMAGEVRAWLATMYQGRHTPPRRKPRSPGTIRLQFLWFLPALIRWAAEGRTSLREITPRDVRTALPPPGAVRARMGQGLRSLFQILKCQQIVFTDPTRGIRTGVQAVPTVPVPVDTGRIRQALDSADPARAAVCALIAFHALTVREIQNLQLTDLDDSSPANRSPEDAPANGGHLTAGDRRIPLAPPVRDRLDAYLAHRCRLWPSAGNPHLFINRVTAATATARVNSRWIERRVAPHFTARALRHDRLLDEAHATGGDPKHLTELFGLRMAAVLRYTATVTHPDLDTVVPEPPRRDRQP
ncbi:hypothetical protein [Streptomyces sp. NPDC001297]|uniref:hypothetical protein n=1 Tax=Streptomyces sp. NPDC001297 TaxID=3364559 RepID=UPI003698E443